MPDSKYSKERILNSEAYKDKRDLINALLEDDKEYTKAEVDKLIGGYQKKVVEQAFRPRKKRKGGRR